MRTFLTGRQIIWSAWVVGALVALVLLAAGQPMVYGLVVPLSALVLAVIPGTVPRRTKPRSVDWQDLLVIGALYLAVVALYRAAEGTDRERIQPAYRREGGGATRRQVTSRWAVVAPGGSS